ncbi:MAG: SpoIID/LytB domain-containing protein [Lachnospiraceae bacterium]|nr:SpoIID/LytB domain-containing protein [Lachnospiraceae bacterium]
MTRYSIKKPEKKVLLFLILLCVGLFLLILYVQGEMSGLQKLLMKNTQSKNTEVKEDNVVEEMPYTLDLRIVITRGDGSAYWDEVKVVSEEGLQTESGGQKTMIGPSETYTYGGETTVCLSALGQGQLHIQGREQGYEGTLQICRTEQGIMVVNEIQMEAYLKRVVPSEMPRTYGSEALKAQAICARTYAYAHSNAYAYPDVQAHMDDTVSFQVYNNCSESSETNQAIAETAGEVLTKGGEVVPTMYYSTSCGYMQDGTLFGTSADCEVYTTGYCGMETPQDAFESYIRKSDPGAYESQERYFRWQATASGENLDELRNALCGLLKEDGAISCYKKMQRRLSNTKKSAQKELGDLEGIKITQRNPGGAAMAMELSFASGKVTVNGELHIRQVLGSIVSGLTLQNGEIISQMSTLPSAAISVDQQSNGTYLIYGGGFGHGVGMSQNGAKALCAMGYTYKDILQYYYKNTTLSRIQ